MEKFLNNSMLSPDSLSSEYKEKSPEKIEVITISDTHNDLEAMMRNLALYGVVGEEGEWKEGIKNVRIIHTGDVVNKEHPDKKSLEYIVHLKNTAPADCSVEVLVGNHEVEYLMSQTGKAEEGSERKLIADNMSYLSDLGPILYVHGHPSRSLLKKITSHGIPAFNEHFKKAMQDSIDGNNEKLKRFSFKKKDLKKDEKPFQKKITVGDYYKIHGPEIQRLLLDLGYRFVVHGHASQQGGVQKTDEFPEMPEITFINNDVSVSSHKKLEPGETAGNKWGSLKITLANAHGKTALEEITVVNKNTHEDVERDIRQKGSVGAEIDSLLEYLSRNGEESLNVKMEGMSRENLLNVAMGIRRRLDDTMDENEYLRIAALYGLVCTHLEKFEEEK